VPVSIVDPCLSVSILFVFLYAVPFRRFQSALAGGGEAAGHLTLIRRIVAVNLVLGLITSAVAA